MKVVVASTNPVKVRAVLKAFKQVFGHSSIKVEMVSVNSGVSNQPMSDKETLKGATKRATKAMERIPNADYWVGIEGGLEFVNNQLSSFTWVVVKSSNQTGKAKSDTYFLPPKIATLIKKGKELGEANDIVFKKKNSKQANGAVGLFTKDLITRDKLYMDIIILALIPFMNRNLYNK